MQSDNSLGQQTSPGWDRIRRESPRQPLGILSHACPCLIFTDDARNCHYCRPKNIQHQSVAISQGFCAYITKCPESVVWRPWMLSCIHEFSHIWLLKDKGNCMQNGKLFLKCLCWTRKIELLVCDLLISVIHGSVLAVYLSVSVVRPHRRLMELEAFLSKP